jgi:hypothetical protein
MENNLNNKRNISETRRWNDHPNNKINPAKQEHEKIIQITKEIQQKQEHERSFKK